MTDHPITPSIAILGCGLIGETHARILAQLGSPPTFFVDSDIQRAKRLAEEFSARASSDPIDPIRDNAIDAVYICTYHDTHAPLAIEAARQGKQIFLEKPMAITASDCHAILDAVQRHRVRCMSGFKLHYYSLAQTAKQLIGQPLALSAQVFDHRWPDKSWANDPVRGGGNVLSQGCHAIELLCYLAGSRPIRIYAEGGNLHHSTLDLVDSMAATLAFENGAIATLLIGDLGETPRNGKFSFQAMNGSKSVHLYDRLTRLSYFNSEFEEVFSGDEDGFLNENREFLAALTEGRQPETTEIDGARATMILLAGIESLRTQEPQSLGGLP
ncbi:MAG: Gfo/Idh/MocA family oxidoreductase [Bacteroidota bacterium]|nr:Gfo/Idh/MocA family oxidoreductase [Bacteroidota bacterium]MDP4243053.1 Gfo/Idh/MocA family oxidoreductase [Bacteroidota bacterium]MDP4287479.1 Gfo/Idh/MocA family oxidoreductase [Bacteroidota bacterium]